MEKLNENEILLIKIMLLEKIKQLDEEIEKIQSFISPRVLDYDERGYFLNMCSEFDSSIRSYRNIYNKLLK